MKKIEDLLTNIGIIKIKNFPEPYEYDIRDYDLKHLYDSEKIIAHKEFLKSVIDQENSRLELIESKTSQIISQTSIVFSLVGLILPIIIEKSSETHIVIRITIILFVLIAFLFYFLSINNALKNFHLNKFKYHEASPRNVLDFKDKSLEEFNSELVRDYLFCINKNVTYNNIKASNLVHSHTTFKIANLVTGITVVLLCIMIFFFNDKSTIHQNDDIKTSTGQSK